MVGAAHWRPRRGYEPRWKGAETCVATVPQVFDLWLREQLQKEGVKLSLPTGNWT